MKCMRIAIAAAIAAVLTASVAFAEEPKSGAKKCPIGQELTNAGTCAKVKQYDFDDSKLTGSARKGSTGPTKPVPPMGSKQ